MNNRIFGEGKFLTGTYEEQLKALTQLGGNSSYVCFCNAHMIFEAQRSREFSELLDEADLLTCDGVPVLWAERFLGKKQIDRFAGMDVIEDIFRISEQKKYRIFLFGGTTEALRAVSEKATEQFPGCEIAGAISPPFRTLSEEELESIYSKINQSGADFVLVALGCPKQEKWMAAAKGKVDACMLGVGAAFATYGEQIDMAPSWMRDNGIEWIYRLAKEPRRLFKRYLIGNAVFVYVFLKHLVNRAIGA